MQAKDQFAELAVDAVLRLKGGTNLEAIHVLKKPGGNLEARSAALLLFIDGDVPSPVMKLRVSLHT